LNARGQSQSARVGALVAITTLCLVTAGCGRASSGAGSTPSVAPTHASSSSPAAAGKGDFGDLKAICGPGNATGGSGRGISASEIRIGVMSDTGAAAAPGLEQEFFDAGDAFSQWCNAAGGINGRKVVIDKWDSKLFNVGQEMVNACQKDFMLVGGGNAFDSAGVKARLACKLGQIAAYVTSPEAVTAGLQVKPTPTIPTRFGYGAIRLMTLAYPTSKSQGVAVGASNLASLIPTGKRAEQALKADGVKFTALQEKPPLVDNYRPYMEQLKGLGTAGLYEFGGQDVTPEIQAMKNIGWNPQWVLYSTQFYTPQTVQAAKALGTFPPTYVGLGHLPFELSSSFPVLQQIKDQLNAAVKNPRYTEFTQFSYIAWALWAQSATECGNDLTQDCVLQKAGAHTDWTGGGLTPPVSTDPTASQISNCFLVVRLTTSGWVYDKKVTDPNNGVYNCDPKNVARVQSYQ
jgi:ABC-type branched-subunit amino acid transport system substrate-binding protein